MGGKSPSKKKKSTELLLRLDNMEGSEVNKKRNKGEATAPSYKRGPIKGN